MKRKGKWLTVFILCSLLLLLPTLQAEAGTVYNSPYVSFSPDGAAFTTNAGDRNYEQYPNGTTVNTGIASTLRSLNTGEHYYKSERDSLKVPIGKWVVTYPYGTCCHDGYPDEDDDYHGINFGRQSCLASYYSGWSAMCADCGESVSPMLMYMSKEAAESITELDLSLVYYYLCPFCNNLEMGARYEKHNCKKISWNQYQIIYIKNTPEGVNVGGYMEKSIHMYNNATEYEGETITPATHLTKNAYSQKGYEFVEWNTEPDGSGQGFTDEQEILNLTTRNISEGDVAKIKLYAQWRKSESTLHINPNGGAYAGNTGISSYKKKYLETYKVDNSSVQPPSGYTVAFNTQGGQDIDPITGTMSFQEWKMTLPFHGDFWNNRYTYIGPDGSEDTLTADYTRNRITLPSATKPGSSFGGWYYDSACTQPAGAAGDSLTPERDMTLYAKWVELVLHAKENYSANGGKGAADLSWEQNDGRSKTYSLYQSRDNANWTKISGVNDISNEHKADLLIAFSGYQSSYTVPYTGFYTLTAKGAQGGNYGEHKGGYGGSASGKVWLKAGEVLTYTVGGQNGFNGGGSADMFANGGGCTVVASDQKGTLLIAGGGGGATSEGNGGAGGSSASVTGTEINGENGGAGGGGGYRGGSAGELIRHYHTADCWKTDDTSYTLIDTRSGDYVHSRIAARKHKIGTWGEAYAAERYGPGGMLGSGAHCGDGDASAYSHYGIVSTPAGEEKVYFPTNGNPILELHWNGSCWDGNGLKNFSVEVYNEKEDCIFSMNRDTGLRADGRKWFEHPYKEEEFRSLNGGNNFLYGRVSGHVDGERSWSRRDLYINEKIDVSGCTGIRVSVSLLVDDGWFGQTMNYLALTGGKNTYTICGYDEGEILTSKPAYGGSNYINTDRMASSSQDAGQQAGNGALTIQSESIGYLDTLALNGVTATDLAAPDAVNVDAVEKRALDGRRVEIVWDKPRDNGTPYYHRAESYLQGSTDKISDSNVTVTTLTSGVAGYYYLVNQDGGTPVGTTNGLFCPGQSLQLYMERDVQYLHLAAVDVAGNVGPTMHVLIGMMDEEIPWPLRTDQVQITSEKESIYPAAEANTYYVRCDGETPFRLAFSGAVEGQARNSYQINYTDFHTKAADGGAEEQIYSIYTNSRAIADGTFLTQAKDLRKTVSGTPILKDGAYAVTTRSDRCQTLSVLHQFVMPPDWHGRMFRVTPVAGADFRGGIQYSPWDEDVRHSIFLIGDGEAPVVSGAEVLESLELIDRNAGDMVLELTARDDLSGVRDFSVEIYNTDNVSKRVYTPDAGGRIVIDITRDEPIFSGDFTVTVRAVDHVGNERELCYSTTEFALHTEISRILEPHEPVFKAGESGILDITTWGYAERVEVEFPDALLALNPELNKTYVYTMSPKYRQEESLQFMIPLYTPADESYVITVRAYKGDKKLEDYPALSTIEVGGSVLDEIRTRLR